jgi:hypothetical protein
MRLIYDLGAMPRLLYSQGKCVRAKGKLENKSTRHVECKRGHVARTKRGKVARSVGKRSRLAVSGDSNDDMIEIASNYGYRRYLREGAGEI